MTVLVMQSSIYDRSSAAEQIINSITFEEYLAETVQGYLPGELQPIYILLNGAEFKPESWGRYQLKAADYLVVVPRPFGFDPFTIAIAVVSIAAASYMASMMQPAVPSAPNFFDLPDQSPTYNAEIQGNTARLGQPVSVGYGLHRVWPSFASQPFRRYIGGDQYLFHILSIGEGLYELSDPQVGDTGFGNFEGIEHQLYGPGERVDLFPVDITTVDTVGNIELFAPNETEYDGWTAAHVLCDAGRTVDGVEFDLVSRGGMYHQNETTGALSSVSVTVELQYQVIDDLDAGVGGWVSGGTFTVSEKTVDPVRRTYQVDLGEGRYQVRMRRTTPAALVDSVRHQDHLIWAELRSHMATDQTYDESVWAVKIKVTDQISTRSERKINVMRHRLLPTWTGTEWTDPVPTRNPAWAFCDVVKGEWGGAYDDSHLDLFELKRLADVFHDRGDYFDYEFDTRGSFWRALEIICAVGRSKPVQLPKFGMVRDEPRTAQYPFSMRNMKAGSFSLGWTNVEQDDYDSIELEYMDDLTWQYTTVLCVLPGCDSVRPKRIKKEGITNRLQAYREGMFILADMVYRNRAARFKTELDGALPLYGDAIHLSHGLAEWGVGGDLLDVVVGDDSNQLLQLSEPLQVSDDEEWQIVFRNKQGKSEGPFVITAGPDEHHVLISSTHNADLYTGWRRSKTQYVAGPASKFAKQFIVRGVEHSGGHDFQVQAVIDNPIVHTFDQQIDSGSLPVPVPADVIKKPLGQVSGLRWEWGGTAQVPELNLSWNPVQNAERYIIQISTDDRVSWRTLESTVEVWARLDVPTGEFDLRIAAMAVSVGPWFEQEFTIGSISPRPDDVVDLALVEAFEGPVLKLDWSAAEGADRYLVEIVADGTTVRATEVANLGFEYTYLDGRNDGVGRAFDVRVWGVSEFGDTSLNPAEISVSNDQMGALGSVVVDVVQRTAMIQVTAPTEADFAGFRVWLGDSETFTPADDLIAVSEADERLIMVALPNDDLERWVRVAAFDLWGTDGMQVSSAFSVKKSLITETEIAPGSIKTPHLAADAVTADVMSVGSLAAISANLGAVTSGSYTTSTINGVRVELNSSGTYPFWIGQGNKNADNGLLYLDKDSGDLVFKGKLAVKSSDTGARTEIADDVIKVFDDNGNLRVQIGDRDA